MKKSIVVLAVAIGLCLWIGTARSSAPQHEPTGQDHAHGEDQDHEKGHEHGAMFQMKAIEVTPQHKALHDWPVRGTLSRPCISDPRPW